jgi:actinin alpha
VSRVANSLASMSHEKQWEAIQKKTFTGWVNTHLKKKGLQVEELSTDFQNGLKLISLLEALSNESFPFKYERKANLRIQKVGNVNYALNFIKMKGVTLAGVGAEEIVDGNLKMILGMIWTIILRFQIQDISVEELSAKEALLLWCQRKTHGYKGVNVQNFHFSFQDGLAFCALIHKHRPDLIDFDSLDKSDPRKNLQLAFDTAEKLGIDKYMDPSDLLDVPKPDERSVITYVSQYYKVFATNQKAEVAGKRVAKVIDFTSANDALKNDYLTRAKQLAEWTHDRLGKLADRTFDNTLNGVLNKIAEFKAYKNNEKPPKVNEKVELEALLSGLNTKLSLNSRPPFQPPEGYTTKDFDKLFYKLGKEEHERSLALRKELRRIKKIEDLARRFGLLAGKLEGWAGERNKSLSSTDYGDSITIVNAKLKNHDAYESEYASQTERLQQLRGLADELRQVNYEKLAEIEARLGNLDSAWSALQQLADTRKANLQAQLEKLQAIENLQLDFAKRALHLRVWLEKADDIVTDPIIADTVEAVQELQDSFNHFANEQGEKTAEFQGLGELADKCQEAGVPEDLFSEVSWVTLSGLWNKLAGQMDTRRQELASESEKQAHHDSLRKTFAEKAQEFNVWIEEKQRAIDGLSGSGSEQLASLDKLEGEISSEGSSRYGVVEHANKQLDEAGVDDNQYTELTPEGLKSSFDSLGVLVKKKKQVVEKEILAQTHSGVSPEQLKEFKDCFSHFDKDGDQHLDRLELGACLKSLGEDVEFEAGGKLDHILKSIDGDGDGRVTFDEFLQYMVQLSSDQDSPANLIAAFKTLAGDKDFVTQGDLSSVLPPEKVQYVISHMKPYSGVQGGYDYKSFADFAYST